ncbi:PA14 domain-containing protein [Georgenia sp. SUBG003]|uniref:PA14 domain-containing protein n=1 Tax=Georgenia sp. SUBG003 TaxID=1497974 RepID=UPI003AB1DB6E
MAEDRRRHPVCEPGQWSGQYFNNKDLAGDVVAVECIDELDLDWNADAPAAGVNANNFSSRWSTTLNEGAGTYKFTARADDGIRVKVDGETVIDEWHAGDGKATYTGELVLTAGSHDVGSPEHRGRERLLAGIGPHDRVQVDEYPAAVRLDHQTAWRDGQSLQIFGRHDDRDAAAPPRRVRRVLPAW